MYFCKINMGLFLHITHFWVLCRALYTGIALNLSNNMNSSCLCQFLCISLKLK